ncbi:hypothetical protein VPHK24_0081 [Vibrio phage K24]|nr:hypothetical protein SIPHO078v2_p0066 [Vibrio phage 14E30.1]QZI92510.1 hypothetical protein SIPHO058v2_p0062 [Vibrio phage 14E30.2]
MSSLTESEIYWSETWCEILSNNGVDICVDIGKHEAIAKDFALNASVQGEYMAPVRGECEIEKLKLQIKKLEERVPCTHCGGNGGSWISVGSHHSSWDDCRHCNGNKWLRS